MKEIKSFNNILTTIKDNYKFLLILVLITFLAYANVLRGEFVTADDFPGIVQNPMVKDLGYALKTGNLVPIKNALIVNIFGMNSYAFHFFGVLFHLINIVLVFVLVRTLFDDKIAKIATIIFALHPVNAESIMWISGNPYAMNGIFSFLIFTTFVLYERTLNKKYYFTSIGIFFLMLIQDRGAWPLVTPFILAIIDQFLFSKKIDIKRGLFTITPFIVMVVVSFALVINTNYANRMESLTKNYYFNPKEAPPLLNRAPFTIYMGLRNLIFPYELNIYPGEKFISSQMLLGINLLAISFVGFLIYLYSKNRIYTGLILVIIASVGPTWSPVQVAWLMTERYLYVGSAFFAIIIAMLLLKLKEKHELSFKVTLGIILVLYVIRLVFRSEDWRTNKNLWLSTLYFSPDSYRVYNNLGDVYIKENNYDKAIESFTKSYQIFPQYADAMHNLGIVYMMKKDLVNAEKYMIMAIKTKPDLVPAWEKMGVIYYQKGDLEKSKMFFLKALQLDPNASLANGAIREISIIQSNSALPAQATTAPTK